MLDAPLKPHHESRDELGQPIGKDPRTMAISELEALGHTKMPLLKVVRKNCLDCVGNKPSEVRRCALASCPFWPYRMGTNPFYGASADAERTEVEENTSFAL